MEFELYRDHRGNMILRHRSGETSTITPAELRRVGGAGALASVITERKSQIYAARNLRPRWVAA